MADIAKSEQSSGQAPQTAMRSLPSRALDRCARLTPLRGRRCGVGCEAKGWRLNRTRWLRGRWPAPHVDTALRGAKPSATGDGTRRFRPPVRLWALDSKLGGKLGV